MSSDVQFSTEDYLPLVRAPILVLHAEDDKIVPFYLGQRLVDTAQTRGKTNIQMIKFESKLGLRHRYIYRAPRIEDIVQSFVRM